MSGFASADPRSDWPMLACSIRKNVSRQVQKAGLIARSAYRMPKPFSRRVMYGRSIQEKMCVPIAPASRPSQSVFRINCPWVDSSTFGNSHSVLVKPVSE